MAKRKRDYRKEYDTYQGTPEQLKNQALRHAARNKRVTEALVKKGDGKEVDHKDGNPRNNKRSNLQVLSRSANRKKGG